jgi:hypothetical protein
MICVSRFTIANPALRARCGVSDFHTALLTPRVSRFTLVLAVLSTLNSQLSTTFAFEGRITAALSRGGEMQALQYTAGTNQIRIERTETDWPHVKNIVNLETGATTILFPHNRSFVRLKNGEARAPSLVPADPSSAGVWHETRQTAWGATALPTPHGIGPTNLSGASQMPQMPAMPPLPDRIGPQAGPGASMAGMPAMPMRSQMTMEQGELKATDQTTNLLGFKCTRYELKQRGEVMEIWATDELFPFQPYMQNQPHRFGPRMLDDQWGETLKSKKLFPLLAILKFDSGSMPTNAPPANVSERLRFEVKSIVQESITDHKLFQPPSDYHELEPLPF